MPEFEYRCPSPLFAHTIISTVRADSIVCDTHLLRASRRFSFAIKSSFPEHYNAAVGQHVSSEQQFKDKLKEAAEVQSIEMGYTADYEYIPREDMHPSTFGVTEEGLYEQEKRHHDHIAAGGKPIT